MKKGKIIALALAAGITFMGAGYAAWTDNVNINATVSTGELNFNADSSHRVFQGYSQYIQNDENEFEDITVEYKANETDSENIDISIGNVFPQASAYIEVKLDNESTIPTKLGEFQLKQKGENNELVNFKDTYFNVECVGYKIDGTSFGKDYGGDIGIGKAVIVKLKVEFKDTVKNNIFGNVEYDFTVVQNFKQFNQ